MSRTAAGLIGGMPMLSESEFKAQKKAAAKEAKEGILREQTKAAAIIEQAKQEKKEASRKVKSSALNKLVASSAAQQDEVADKRAQKVQEKLDAEAASAALIALAAKVRRPSYEEVLAKHHEAEQASSPRGMNSAEVLVSTLHAGGRNELNVADMEAEKREIAMGLELGRLRIEVHADEVVVVSTETNRQRSDLNPSRHGFKPKERVVDFDDGYKTLARPRSVVPGTTPETVDLVKAHALKNQREERIEKSRAVEDKAAAFLASLK